MKSLLVGAMLINSDGRTERQEDMAKATGLFRNYTIGPENKKDFKSENEHSAMSL